MVPSHVGILSPQTCSTLRLVHFARGNAHIAGIVAQPAITVSPPAKGSTTSALSTTFPAQSITPLVVPKMQPLAAAPGEFLKGSSRLVNGLKVKNFYGGAIPPVILERDLKAVGLAAALPYADLGADRHQVVVRVEDHIVVVNRN